MNVWYTYVNIRTRKHSLFVPFGTRPCANYSAAFSEKVGNGAMLQFAKNTYLSNLNNFHLLWETNFVSLAGKSTFESQSFPLFLLGKQCNSCRLPWSVGRALHSKAGGNEFNGPFAWSSHLVQKTPRCKANNAVVPWKVKKELLANFEWSDFFIFLVSLY